MSTVLEIGYPLGGKRLRFKHLFMLLSSLLLLAVVFVYPWLYPWHLTVYAPKDDQLLYAFSLQSNDSFTLKYTHSVTHREVSGTFAVTNDGKIKPLTTTFDTYGPGLPYLDGSVSYIQQGDAYVVSHAEEPRDKISLFVSSLTREHLLWETGELDLSSFRESPQLLHIYPERKFRYMGYFCGKFIEAIAQHRHWVRMQQKELVPA